MHLPLTTDEGDGQPPDGEQQRMINKDTTLCDEWEAMILVATALFCEGEPARVALSCLRDRPPRGTFKNVLPVNLHVLTNRGKTIVLRKI